MVLDEVCVYMYANVYAHYTTVDAYFGGTHTVQCALCTPFTFRGAPPPPHTHTHTPHTHARTHAHTLGVQQSCPRR